MEDAGDADGTANSIQTQRCNVLVVTILQAHTECSQEGRPCHLHTHTQTYILKQILDVAVTGNFFPFLGFAGGYHSNRYLFENHHRQFRPLLSPMLSAWHHTNVHISVGWFYILLCFKLKEPCPELDVFLSDLEHGSDMLEVSCHGETGLDVTDALHQGFGCLGHLLHLHVVQQPPLLVARDILCNSGPAVRWGLWSSWFKCAVQPSNRNKSSIWMGKNLQYWLFHFNIQVFSRVSEFSAQSLLPWNPYWETNPMSGQSSSKSAWLETHFWLLTHRSYSPPPPFQTSFISMIF